ncbi:MAG: 50S ribosomal protein L3 [Candidatus Kapabacteria bacterium]|nr:50S ribosomal protein L3 [Candidatus Kapabacteria bacterium]
MKAAILGKKLGMTSFFKEDGVQLPCTVVEAGPCPVVQLKTKETDGYSAIQVGFGKRKKNRTNKPLEGHFKKNNVDPTQNLKEFRDLPAENIVENKLTIEQFKKGDKVKVSGTSIGRGFQGVVKRHHFSGVGMTTHGQSDRQRHPGSIGASSYPSRVIKGIRMAGRMGGKTSSVRNIEVIEIIPDRNLILLKGSIPGSKNSLVEIVIN